MIYEYKEDFNVSKINQELINNILNNITELHV
jgi:predicted small metal-binding protein